jgi:hypothetical protein
MANNICKYNDYSYKSHAYYDVLQHELHDYNVQPTTIDILDAYNVPLCLERAMLAGIPVCSWEISQGYFPTPVIMYGLNNFSTKFQYFVINEFAAGEKARKYITADGRYPFCYQKITPDAYIQSCYSYMGESISGKACTLSQRVYDVFKIPLVNIITVHMEDQCLLSALTGVPESIALEFL